MSPTTKILLALLTLAVLATEASAQSTTTLYNSSGQSIGRATTSGNTTTFRDSSGRTTSRAVTNGNTTTNYDAGGRVISRETTTANTTTTFRDSSGRTTGRATTNGNTTTTYDASGKVISREFDQRQHDDNLRRGRPECRTVHHEPLSVRISAPPRHRPPWRAGVENTNQPRPRK